MGGDVGVDSEPGRGSRFWFRIRADIAHSDEAHAIPSSMLPGEAQATALSPRHILVVEDDRTSRSVIVALLRRMNLTVDTAGDGQQALAALTQGARPDLVLMDIQMPVMDGHETTERIRQWETQTGRPRLPIVALTARAYEKDRQDCLRSGMDDFLEKPIDVSEVMAMLKKWTGQDA
jgi:CheY-like chemotaxis protein